MVQMGRSDQTVRSGLSRLLHPPDQSPPPRLSAQTGRMAPMGRSPPPRHLRRLGLLLLSTLRAL